MIVFDSPAKTREEIRKALELGVTINADNLSEVRGGEERRKEGWSEATAAYHPPLYLRGV